jgi:hypothetical protein
MMNKPNDPSWWNDTHTSNWDNVKGALERDWEQTKSDLSATDGRQLNQGLGDTLLQATGQESIPPLGVQTHADEGSPAFLKVQAAREHMEATSSDASEVEAKAREEIARHQGVLGAKVAAVQQQLAVEEAKANRKTADQLIAASQATVDRQAEASERIAEAHAKAALATLQEEALIVAARDERGEAVVRWHEAEREVRYGYAVRSQYPAGHEWDAALESKLQGEWDVLTPEHPFSIAKQKIRRGWEYASRKA